MRERSWENGQRSDEVGPPCSGRSVACTPGLAQHLWSAAEFPVLEESLSNPGTWDPPGTQADVQEISLRHPNGPSVTTGPAEENGEADGLDRHDGSWTCRACWL